MDKSHFYTAMDKSHVTLLALFDASSAFGMVDHDILLQRLETSFGLSGTPRHWFRFYLSDRFQMLELGENTLLGFLSNLGSLRALFRALSSTSYSQPTFFVYLINSLPQVEPCTDVLVSAAGRRSFLRCWPRKSVAAERRGW